MIVPMMKYDFVLYHADLAPFLDRLQELGIVDTKRSNKPIDERSSTLLDEIDQYTQVIGQLSRVKSENTVQPDDKTYSAKQILLHCQELTEEKEQLKVQKSKLLTEIKAARPWQMWSMTSLDQLAQIHCTPRFYAVQEKKYNPDWEQEYPLAILNKENGYIYFVVLEQKGAPYHFPLQDTKLPSASIELLEVELTDVEHRLTVIGQQFETYALQKDLLASHRSELVAQLDLYLAGKGSASAAEDTLSVVTAFVPKPQQQIIEDFIAQSQVIYLSEEAVIEDDPPIKLKNNRFARLYEPIGDLFMPPRYDELDVTAYFAPFYMLFFGFCMGDFGYGIVILLASTIAKLKLKKMKPILTLMQYLGVGCIVMPLLFGTVFGLDLSEVFLLEGVFLDTLQMFWFALIMGGFTIFCAKIIQAIDAMKRRGFQYGLAPLGWAILLICIALKAGQEFMSWPIPPILIPITLYLGLALIIFFASDSKNIFARAASGVASLWGVTGMFADFLSYIRLFGLGVAGGILGFVVNTVGALVWTKLPYIGYVIGGLIFVVGHLAVLVISAIGAIVHPLRLTFVEFYKNVGFTGGGRLYRPLKKE